jgi:hypothetical protein
LKLHHQQYKNLLLRICKDFSALSREEIKSGLLEEATIKAVKKGIDEFVKAILSACPELVWCQETDSERNLFMLAVCGCSFFSHLPCVAL